MRKLLILLFAPLLFGQIYNNSQSVSVSGTTITVPNLQGSLAAVFHEVVTGAPASATVVVSGCTAANSCTQMDSFTFTGNGYTYRSLSSATSYDHYAVTPTWTGGAAVSVTVGTTIPRNANSGGSSSITLGGDLSGTPANATVAKINGQAPAPVATTNDYNSLVNLPSLSQPTPTPGLSINQVVSGCGVEYVAGLNFNVGQCNYQISGTNYASAITSVTLASADPTNPRIDVIGVNATGVFSRSGTPAANPVEPSVDAATELQLRFVYVPAGASAPNNVVTDNIYDENTEWTTAVTSNINAASTNNPYRSTKDAEATNAVLNNNITFTKPASGTVDLGTRNYLSFYIRPKAAWPTGTSGTTAARYLTLFWLNGSTQKGTQVVLRDGQFGFKSSTLSYQQINIPTSAFAINGVPVTTLEMQVTGSSGSASIGWYVDAITLQGGSNTIYTQLFNVVASYIGKPAAGATIYVLTLTDPISIPSNFAGAAASCGVNPTSTSTYSVLKNGTSVGTIALSTACKITGSTTGNAAVTWASGDRMTITAPSPQDATASDVGITVRGLR